MTELAQNIIEDGQSVRAIREYLMITFQQLQNKIIDEQIVDETQLWESTMICAEMYRNDLNLDLTESKHNA